MGKSNRIRSNRANDSFAREFKGPKKKQGMPSWALNTITIVVAAIILFSVAFGLMTANGVFGRMRTAVKSDHFRVNENMWKYYFQTQYQNYASNSYTSINTAVPLDQQTVSSGSTRTWYDVINDQTKASVEELLVWCEEAKARGIKLTREEKKEIKQEAKNLADSALNSGYTLAMMYGEGVTEKDVRDCMKLSALASKCTEVVYNELKAGVTPEAIQAEFDANAADYEFVDMLTYKLEVKFSDIEEELGEDATSEELIKAYTDKINEIKAQAKALSGAASADAFKDLVAQYAIDKIYDDAYDEASETTEVAEADRPADVDAIKTKLVAYILERVQKDEAYDEAAALEAIGEVSENYETFIKDVASSVYSDTKSTVSGTDSEGNTYSDGDELLEWAFDASTAVGSLKTVESGDSADGEALSDKTDELDYFRVNVGMLTKAKYIEETPSKNVGIIAFSSQETAVAAIAKLQAGMSLDAFKAVADEMGGSFTEVTDYTKGSLGVSAFDTWLYGDGVTVGSITATPISADESTYIIALYYADGELTWKVEAKNAIVNAEYTKASQAYVATHRPNFKVFGDQGEIFNGKAIASVLG